MVREALQVTEVAIKLSALGIKNALALSLAYAKENPKVKGKTSLDRLLREGKELKIIALQSKDVGQFKELAKQYGVLFAVVKDKAQNEKVDVMFKAEDVAKLNRIYEQLGYAIPKVTTADRKKDPTRRQSGDSLLTRGKNPLDIDPRPSVRATIMALKKAARTAAQAQEKVQDITAKEERYKVSSYGEAGKIWMILREKDYRKCIYLLNLCGQSEDYWNEGKEEPNIQKDIKFTVQVDTPVEKICFSTPDGENMDTIELSFTERATKTGKFIDFTVPSLNYWTTIWIDTRKEII